MTLPSSQLMLSWLRKAVLGTAAVIGFLLAIPFIVAMTFAGGRGR